LIVARDGTVSGEAADPSAQEQVKRVVAEINKRDTFRIDAAPPKGANPRASYSRLVKRGDTDFVAALIQLLRRSYALLATEQTGQQ
jgi:hypothetical protein